MTVSAAPALAGPFDGNDVATTFPFDFKIFADSDLRVVLRDALSAEYLLTLGVDYSVSMNPDQNADPGGSITYPLSGPPLATGERLTVTTDLELSQQTVFTNLGKFFPATVEDTFDRVVMLLRQIQAENDRALRVPVSLSDVLTDLPTPVAGAALVWNDDGTALVNGVPTESLIAISSFMANVIQAVDAAEARSDIGAAADADVVKLTGAQTVAGVKTFSSAPKVPDGAAADEPATKGQLDAQIAAAAPPGAVLFFAMDTAPVGWLKADGSIVSRTAYAALFAAIGTTFGVGDGSTTFGLPDLRGEFIRGFDDGRGVDSARVLGSYQGHQMQSHTHTTPQGLTAGGSWSFNGGGNGVSSVSGAAGGTSNSSENRPRNIALLACIKY